MYYVYILRSLRDNKKYIGMTENMERRFVEHTNGKVKSTRSRRPLVLVFNEIYHSKTDAMAREKFFKSGKGREYLKIKLNIK